MAKRILVYGVGVIGSVYALRLSKAGFHVSVVARGDRLAAIRASGLVVRHALLGDEERAVVEVLEAAPEGWSYDLVLMALRSGQVESALRALARARVGGPVAVIGNNLGDLRAQASIVGGERFLPGFGMIGGYRDGDAIVYLDWRNPKKRDLSSLGKTTLGIVDERARPALDSASRILEEACLPVTENPDIAAWLAYHAALVFPLAGSMYAAAGDQARYCRTRDAIALGVRACRELFGALSARGLSMQPKSLKSLAHMPEWLLVPLLAKRLSGESARVAMFGHANAPGGRDEISGQAAILDAMAREAGLPLPAWERLLPYFSPVSADRLIPDGSRSLRLRLL